MGSSELELAFRPALRPIISLPPPHFAGLVYKFGGFRGFFQSVGGACMALEGILICGAKSNELVQPRLKSHQQRPWIFWNFWGIHQWRSSPHTLLESPSVPLWEFWHATPTNHAALLVEQAKAHAPLHPE
jgi:hypothetical protein